MVAARQQRRRGAKMINNNWQVLGVGLMDMRETARIVASNTARIDLPHMATIDQSPNQITNEINTTSTVI